MSERYDAIVVGAGVNGLVAVALLAKAGLRTLLLERLTTLHGDSGEVLLHALDPQVVKLLNLTRHGLRFAVRDISLMAPRPGGPNLTIARDRHVTARSLAALSAADAVAFEPWRRELFTLARALRPCWWKGRPLAEIRAALRPSQRALLDRLSVTSAANWLSGSFESDALKAALAFAAASCGVAPSEPGSALALAFTAAQEMCGRQSAVAQPRGGAAGLCQALADAAQKAGAEIRTTTTVSSLLVAKGAIAGVELVAGESIAAPMVLSTLSRLRTLGEMLPAGEIGLGAAHGLMQGGEAFGCAALAFTLERRPDAFQPSARAVLAERLEIYEAALAAVRTGALPAEPPLELFLPTPETGAAPILTARVWPVAAHADRAALTAQVVRLIERHIPGFSGLVTRSDVLLPSGGPVCVDRLSAASATRIETPVQGLLLCGGEAEPAEAVSGVAARQAATAAIALHKKVRVP
jgi:phytoene dehydrogenase-like protein